MTQPLILNEGPSHIMHIDLNSCFATIEQQANPFLRGRPVVVAAYPTPRGIILSPSIEAKRYGIKTGMRIKDAQLLCANIIALPTDPPKYRDVHKKFMKIFTDYSPMVVPKSIDEAIIDFKETSYLFGDLEKIAREIKMRLRKEVGEWISCSIGIAPNRFWAKTGASLHKPDGLDHVNHENILRVLRSLTLVDLHGINVRYQARLNAYGIFTPLQFLAADERTLKEKVFKGVVGSHWYFRLRGFEVDDVVFEQKSIGHQYAIGKKTADKRQLAKLLLKLTEKTGRRLRQTNQTAYGIHVACRYNDGSFWHMGKKWQEALYTTQELYGKALWIFEKRPEQKIVTLLSVTCYGLQPNTMTQATLFEETIGKKRKMSQAMDSINDRYGEFTIVSGLLMGTEDVIGDSIAFGKTRELLKE